MAHAGKTAVIFGGSGAVGRAVGQTLAHQGAHVHLVARNCDRLAQASQSIEGAGGAVATLQVDVLDGEATAERMAQLARHTGGIDIAINATGFLHDQGKEISELSHAEFMKGVAPFLSAQFNICKAVSSHMGGERGGSIITVVAPAGQMAAPGHLGHVVGRLCARSVADASNITGTVRPAAPLSPPRPPP